MRHLISDEYREQNAKLHARDADYGIVGGRWAQKILEIEKLHAGKTILDYGCGKGRLKQAIMKTQPDRDPDTVRECDPAIPGKDAAPYSADVVVCDDVLEHVEMKCMANVVRDIIRLANCAVFVCISCRASKRKLPDGRTTHIIVRSPDWWDGFLSAFGEWERVDTGIAHEFAAMLRKDG